MKKKFYHYESDKTNNNCLFNSEKINDNIRHLDELRDCFEQSRLTHPMIGFKHETFEDYLKELSKIKS